MKRIWEAVGEINVKMFVPKELKEAEAQLSKLSLVFYAAMVRYGSTRLYELRWFQM